MQNDNFLLNQVLVCPTQNTLSLDGQELTIQPKVMDVLSYLAEHQNRVISLDELIDELWHGSVVSNHSVQRCISAIRKHFTELLGEGEYVKSFTKKGYQLCLTKEKLSKENLSKELQDKEILDKEAQAKTLSSENGPNLQTPHPLNNEKKFTHKNHFAYISLALFVLAGLALFTLTRQPETETSVPLKTFAFNQVTPLTTERGLEIYPEPHPDNEHFVFAKLRDKQYQLIVRAFDGSDWKIAESPGKWDMFAWSPDGSKLIASSANFTNSGTSVNIYLFDINIENKEVIKQSLIIPWEGDVFSVTWKNENTLEMTARYGLRGEHFIFRYDIPSDKLEKLDSVAPSKAPHLVDIQNGKTAIASYFSGGIAIDIFDKNSNKILSKDIETAWLDMSWAPDGEGILILNDQKFHYLNLNGDLQQIPYITDKAIHRPRFSADGKSILFTQTSSNSDIWLLKLNGEKIQLTEHEQNDALGIFSSTGDTIYYHSHRLGIDQIRAIVEGEDRFITKAIDDQAIYHYTITANDTFLFYKTARGIYRYNLKTKEHQLAFEDTERHFPLAYYPEKDVLHYANHDHENTNVWRINLKSLERKQITFGTVYFTIHIGEDIYFQYFNKNGLYHLKMDEKIPKLINKTLPANSHLTMVDNKGVYYMTMDHLQQTDVFYLDLESGETSTFLTREKDGAFATSIHPKHGMLLQLDQELNGNILRLH